MDYSNQTLGTNAQAGSYHQLNASPQIATPISSAATTAEERLKQLSECVSHLEARLEVFCSPQGPESGRDGRTNAAMPPAGSAHQMFLANLGFGIGQVSDRLGRLLQRLEV